MKIWYQKIITIEPILQELNQMDLSDEERAHLSELLDSSLHHAILDEILSNLTEEDKKLFLKMLHEDPENEKLVNFLNEKIDRIDERVKKVADDLVKEMHQEVKEAKKVK
ncbi:MAG: hypothetical protein HYW45_01115 [Candidatus Daviesbacteria bacterium]|nr:MAG: hypothetical protein HYW45_01115 [Candidatus Daviesbacteria bacterium]